MRATAISFSCGIIFTAVILYSFLFIHAQEADLVNALQVADEPGLSVMSAADLKVSLPISTTTPRAFDGATSQQVQIYFELQKIEKQQKDILGQLYLLRIKK